MKIEQMYEQMLLIRRFEERLTELFQQGFLFGTVHCCIGQEAVAVGIVNTMDKHDIVTSNHRGHGHFIALTDDVEGLMAEIMGKQTGVCRGRGGSQHLHKDNFYSNGITGGMIPIATGMAYAEKLKKSGGKVVAFLGDGALSQGVVYESWNMASLWELPILYVVENNLYAMSTSIYDHFAGDIKKRAEAFGMKATEMPDGDVEQVYGAAKTIMQEIAQGTAPQVLICSTYRFCGHSKSDDLCYRTREEEEQWLAVDPVKMAGQNLSQTERDTILGRVEKRIDKAVEEAKKAEFQDSSVLNAA